MSKTKFTLFSIACVFTGFLIGRFIYPDLPEVKSSRTTTSTTTIEKIEGMPDTSFKYESFEESDVVYPDLWSAWRQSAVDSLQLAIGSEEDSSLLKKKFNYEFGSVDVSVTTYPGVDSADIKVKADVKQITITRVDTIHKTTEIKTTDSVVVTIEKETEWAVHVGSFQLWNNQVDVFKYAELSYQHKIWFVNVKASLGFFNRLEQSFNGFQPMSKLELNIALN